MARNAVFGIGGALLSVLALVACEGRPSNKGQTSASTSLPADTAGLYVPTSCGGATARSPVAGSVFEHKLLGPDGATVTAMGRTQTIRTVTGDQVDYSETLSMPGMPPSPVETRQMRLGFLPTVSTGRSVRFEDAARTVDDLVPGQSAALRMTETREDEAGRQAEGQARITFVGCGRSTSVIAGAPNESVRVYRLRLPFSAMDRPGRLSETADLEFLISDRLGWPVAERSPSGTLVLTTAT